MKRISVDNGMHWVSPETALETIDIDTMTVYMDDDTRDAVYYDIAPCADAEFVAEYLRRAPMEQLLEK